MSLTTRLLSLSFAALIAACANPDEPDSAPAQNRAPVAVADVATTTRDTAVTVAVLANDSDPDGDALRGSGIQLGAATNGAVAVSGNGVRFTPATGFTGTAGFSYSVADARGARSNTAAVTVTVTAPTGNVAPTLSTLVDRTVAAGTASDSQALSVTDPDSTNFTFTGASSNTALVPASGITFPGTGASRSVTVTPVPGQSGNTVITVTVSDGEGGTASATFTFTVSPPVDTNRAPVATDGSVSGNEDTAIGGTLTATDADGDALSYAVATAPEHGTVELGEAGNFTYTPAANYFGPDTFTFTAGDGRDVSAPATVTLSIAPVNDAPVAQALTVAGTEDSDLPVQLAGSDVDGDALSFAVIDGQGPQHGTLLTGPDGAYTYTPFANFSGTDTFQYAVNDGTADSAAATVTLTIANAAEPTYTVTALADGAEAADGSAPVKFGITFSRAPDTAVTLNCVQGGTAGGADVASCSPITFVPGDANLSRTVELAVTDDGFDENTESVELTLAPASAQDAAGTDTPSATASAAIVDNDDKGLLRVGAAKRSVTPTDAQILGQMESYAGGERLQQFHLGGFGFGPFKLLPAYGGATPEVTGIPGVSNGPALARCFSPTITGPTSAGQTIPESCEDHTWVRVMIVAAPGDANDLTKRVAFVTLDAVGAGNLIQDAVKAAVAEATCAEGACVAPANVLFGQTHTHAGADLQGLWGGVPREWIEQAVVQGAASAAAEAVRDARPAQLKMARGYDERFNNYRRPRFRTGDNAALHEADTTVTVLQAASDEGEVLGTLLQYAAHPTAIGTGDYRVPGGPSVRVPHADYPIGAEYDLEREFGGTALYYNGPIADASASGGPGGVNAYDSVRRRGAALAASARAILAQNAVPLDPVLSARSTEVILPITNPAFLALGLSGVFNGYYQFSQIPFASTPGLDQIPPDVIAQFEDVQNQLPQPTPVARTLVSRVSLGSVDPASSEKNRLEIVTIPGEATNTFGQYIRGIAGETAGSEARPDVHTMLLGLTHNSFGYIIPEEEFSYVDPSGDAGFVAPFTGYEENVSLGPLTAPLLRIQGYNVLFDGSPEQNLPPALTDCSTATDYRACIVGVLQDRLAQITGGAGAITGPIADGFETLAEGCVDFGFPEEFCSVFQSISDAIEGAGGGLPPVGGGASPADLVFASADAQARGCDLLDSSNCLYPFPSDWFTAEAAEGSIQHADNGGTGRRVNINPLATPRNTAGKPVDPTEWNRSDGFSPGALIATYVPGLSLEKTFGQPAERIGLADLAAFQHPDSPILVLEVGEDGPVPYPVWAELDANANQLTVAGVPNVGKFPIDGVTDGQAHVARPQNDGRAALLIRPAKNFREGARYVVVLRNLKNAAGEPIPAGAGFSACVAGDSPLPPVQARCEQLEEKVFPVLEAADIDPASVYLAWDFTVLSTDSAIGRLRHMRDEAFRTLSADASAEDCTQLTAGNADDCAPPQIEITRVVENPEGGIARLIEGYLTVPNFLAPAGPSPLDDPAVATAYAQLCASAPEGEFRSGCGEFADPLDIAKGLALPSRLFYSPADGQPAPDAANATDPTGLRYGDGLPDVNGSMTTRFFCQLPAQASPDTPARASLYGHGQLDRGIAITYESTDDVAREHNFMFCAVDWFGFRTGDAVNVVSSLVDLSNFPVIPDASQQGMVNFMFLARAMKHPQGLATLPEFQKPRAADGKLAPVFDRSEVYYNGNSQGGIFGGVVLAASKDVNRGVLGSLGMNYSTLLTRSKNFDEYAGLLYNSYTDPLDRQLLFSMMQMLWDRSENDGYAHHIADNRAFGGPDNQVTLDTMYGDPQVTMFSAEVMARTMGIPYDDRQSDEAVQRGAARSLLGTRHPTVDPYYGLEPLAYTGHEADGSALIVWDTNKEGFAFVPPTNNTPPYAGPDNHDASQKTAYGRCHIAHFLSRGKIIDVLRHQYGGRPCDALPALPATVPPDEDPVDPPAGSPLDAILGAGDTLAEMLAVAGGHLAGGDVKTALDTLIGGLQQVVADASQAIAVAIGDAAGIFQPAPNAGAVNNPPPELLMAGAAKGEVRVPVGTPLGGYLRPPVGGEYIGDDLEGEITDNAPAANDGCDPTAPDTCLPLVQIPDELRKVHSPYATYSPPSRGYYDSLLAKAVALYDGHDYVVMVKTDFIGMLDELVQDVKAEVKARKGIDLRDGLIMSATHSHDGPGAVANMSTRYFWLAMDVYQHDVYKRVVDDLATVVVAALDDLQPAKIGHGNGLESPETVNGNGINGYRRGRLGTYDDNDTAGCAYVPAAQCPAGIDDANELRKRIGVIRVDARETGDPIAVVINFADHGIAFDVENQYFSGDVLGAIEREVEQSYTGGAAPIAMLVQNTGGDVTPKNVEYSIRGIEQLGQRMAPQVRAIADGIAQLDARPDLRTVSQRVILNRDTLDYAADEYPYPWGAAQCGNDVAVPFVEGEIPDEIPSKPDEIPGATEAGVPSKMPYCIPGVPPDAADLADNGVAENGAFVPGDTILYAAKIGAMTLLVQPGEPLVEYGVRVMELAQAEGYSAPDTFIWGYAGDHIGYILPPEREDFEQFGGAESTTTFWGWKQGQRFLDVQRELLRALKTGTAAPADEFAVDYSKYRAIYDAKPPVPATPSLLPGAVVTQPASIQRFGKTTFTFEGGDPVVDYPKLRMLRADGSPVTRANGEPITTYFENHLKYRLTTGRHLWTIEFEAPKDWAAGSYRFAIDGIANQGVDAPYDVESANFQVTPATNLTVAASCTGGACVADLKYAPAPTNYRAIDAFVNNDQSAPVRRGTVTFVSGNVTRTVSVDGNGRATANLPGSTVSISGQDAWGNTASAVTVGPPAPDADGDGVPDGNDTCPGTPSGTPVDANGCPVTGGDEGFPLCEPISGENFCLSDIPGIGVPLQDAIDTVYAALTGGGGEPPSGLPEPCAPDGVPGIGGQCLPGAGEPAPTVDNASCATGNKLDGNRSYQVTLTSASGHRISFQVLEPIGIQCAGGKAVPGAHPLVLHGHGFGGSRNTSATSYRDNYRENGYAVISIDQRGFGDSTGTVRVMDPDAEGRDIVQILDWAEANLDYLAYRNELAAGKPFVARPAGGVSTGAANLVVGAQGGSYGGGYQFMVHNVDTKDRLDALAPDITWHDLRYSLNPGDVVKSGFDLLLSVGGARGTYQPALGNGDRPDERGLDPYIVEALARGAATNEFPADALEWFRYHSPTYWCDLNNEPTMPYPSRDALADPNLMLTGAAGDEPGSNTRTGQPGVDMLISQGFRDTLFNFNDAWYNYQCARVRGGDVRLITHQSGHILNLGSLGVPVPAGTPLDIQAPGQGDACGTLPKYTATLQFFNEKLRGAANASSLDRTDGNKVCLSLAEGDSVFVPEDKVLAPHVGDFEPLTASYTAFNGVAADTVPQGIVAQNLYLSGAQPVTAVPLATVTDADGLIVAGIATASVTLRTPQMVNDAACEVGSIPTIRTGCDAILFLGLGAKAPLDADWRLLDDQLTPVRGLGTHANVEFAGSAERLKQGDQIALLVYGYHPQFLGSYSRDATIQAVNVTADLKLPLYAATAAVANSAPDLGASAEASIQRAGSGSPVDTDGDGVNDDDDLCPTQSGPASNNGCPVEDAGLPLCADFMGETYCLTDLDGIAPVPVGGMIQDAVDTVYNAVTGGGGGAPAATPAVLAAAAEAALRGCDVLDPASCLYPFPSDQYTVAIEGEAAQSQNVYTGRRVNLSPLAMPRNVAGKPIDPTEWNRNDGFSAGTMITTYVPGLDRAGLLRSFGFTPGADPDRDNRVGITNPEITTQPDSPILVIDAETGERHPVWAEMDVNADYILPATDELQGQGIDRPQGGRSSLILRPARNFTPGHRYVVVLRKLLTAGGAPIPAGPVFAACRDEAGIPDGAALQARCDQLDSRVFPVLDDAGVVRDGGLYLAWDFTVASAQNITARLTHMRDDAFKALARPEGPLPLFFGGDTDCTRYDYADEPADLGAISDGYVGDCRSPGFTVDKIEEVDGGSVIQIQGTLKVPSYLQQPDPSPLEAAEVQAALDLMKQSVPGSAPLFDNDLFFTGQPFNLVPPNRLNYDPTDNTAPPVDPDAVSLLPYGDGLPDRVAGVGEMTTRFLCEVKKEVYEGTEAAARPAMYGHGLLQSRAGLTYDEGRRMVKRNNFMLCGLDWFGFSQGDLHNVAASLVDMSNFPAIPDASQQGMLNFMFLARAMQHPGGFASHEAFRLGGSAAATEPFFDRSEIFYYGNSQGGILPGPVVAVSKDVNRGVFGVPGMNYSTLLRRSTDFTLYSIPLYLSYQDELDRNLVFGLMQMIWDRAENNGFAAYLTPDGAAVHGGLPGAANLDGQDNQVLLHPAFSDHQVSYWTADVMARTMNARSDRQQITGDPLCQADPAKCDPDFVPAFGLPPVQYSPAGVAGPGPVEVVWRRPEVKAPPIVELPPSDEANGPDPHGYPRNHAAAVCQMTHFLRLDGAAVDVFPLWRVNGVDQKDQDAFVQAQCDTRYGRPRIPATLAKPGFVAGGEAPAAGADYGPGILGAFSQFMGELNTAVAALIAGDAPGTQAAVEVAAGNLAGNLSGLPSEGEQDPVVGVVGDDPAAYATREAAVNRQIEAVVITGDRLGTWSVPAAFGLPYPYPSGAVTSGEVYDQFQDNDPTGLFPIPGQVRDAHNGVMLYPQDGAPTGQAVARIAAYQYDGSRFIEIPVQVDERFPYFLANAASDFSVYSGTDEELTYAWGGEAGDPFAQAPNGEKWNADGAGPDAEYPQARMDPVAGLDHDDEVVFMYRDAGAMAPALALPTDDPDFDAAGGLQEIALADPLQPDAPKYVYLGLKREGAAPKFAGQAVYVRYARDSNADQWIDRGAFCENDPEKLGTSNTGYGPNRSGNVYVDAGACVEPFPQTTRATPRVSGDRFPRDGLTVTTDTYRWRATGRWMVREVQIDNPATPQLDYGADLIDRWKGRAFQQSPDSVISLVGFEDEQVNWEANSTLLGERCGPVRCIREVWGADSGTNVTKTETFYRDAVASRYRVRVHPIPSDGLYTSWDYNRGAMVLDENDPEGTQPGRYYSALRPQGVPVDGINDDVGQSDQFPFCRQLYDSAAAEALFPPLAQVGAALGAATEQIPFAGTTLDPYDLESCAAFFDAADPTFNLPLAFNNWEQVSGKGSLGSLVYVFEVKGATSFGNPLVVPYYRDDACLDDGTGDDPVARPFPGESYGWNGGAVPKAYNTRAGRDPNGPLVECSQRQGAYASHGVHYFVTHDSDNAFVMGKPTTEADAQWWQIMVPTAQPENRGAEHANVVRVPVQAVVTPRPGLGGALPVPAGAFQAGAAKVDSTPDRALCTGGYGIFCGWLADRVRPNAIGGEDRLYTRAIVIGSGDERLAMVTTSAIGLFASYKDEIAADGSTRRRPGLYDTRLRVAQETGIPVDRIFIQSDHSHRSPDTIGIWGGVPADYYQQLQDDMAQAVRLATEALEPAGLRVGAIDGAAVSCPGSFPFAPGRESVPMRCTVDSLYNYDPNKVVDDQFRLLEARRTNGTLIASFANYSTHATVLDDTGSAVFSGDWTGWLAAMLDDGDGVGLATVGTLGRTDFESGNNTGDGDGRNLNREKAARARLQYFLGLLRAGTAAPGVTPMTPVRGSGIRSAEMFLREPVTNPIFYGNYAPFVGAPAGEYPSQTQASIDRSITPPFLTGNVLGTFAGAFRIGDLFFATAPGEEFPNSQIRLRDEAGVLGPQMHFFLGATNDFLGYMGPAESYDQVVAQGATYFFCPPGDFERQGRETVSPVTGAAGYEAGRLFDEGSCPDHFILMASPTIGDHVTCAIQNAAEAIGFGVAVRDPACAVLTAADNLLAPPAQAPGSAGTTAERGLMQLAALWVEDATRAAASAMAGDLRDVLGSAQLLLEHAIQGLADLVIGNPTASVQGVVTSLADADPSDTPATVLSLLLGHAPGTARAGAAVVDMTPDVGYCAGQYCAGLDDSAALLDAIPGVSDDGVDPFGTAKLKQKSYGVQSRLTARAIVVEGANGKRVALIKTDNYLAQDSLIRRVAQILEQGRSGIGYEQILHHVTHNHSSSYSSTPSWGVWVFEDALDLRFFEQQARRMALAIEMAAENLKPARMGATTVPHKAFKGNVVRHAVASDGTPAGYPLEYGDAGVVVMRFDEVDAEGDFVKPIAIWMNWGEHPEGLDPEDLHSADFLAALERFVDRDTGAPLVFSQGDVGSAESSGNECEVLDSDGRPIAVANLVTSFEDSGKPRCDNAVRNAAARKLGTWRDWEHEGYVQIERNVRFLADAVIDGWHQIGAGGGQVPLSRTFEVDFRNAFVPGPASQPAPMVSNCSTGPSMGGDVGVPVAGLPDCARYGQPGQNPITDQTRLVHETLKAEGVPVPDHYGFTGFTGVEENLRLKLQAFRLGEVLLASCACEAQVDLILNLESRADDVAGNIYDGFDWACVVEDANPATRDPAYAQACAIQRTHYNPGDYTAVAPMPGSLADPAEVARMRAQIHNDARGWDLPENALHANSEPRDVRRIWGNFTKEELPPHRGYKLAVGVGHAGDYNGYTISYREFMSRDSYRKALTAYGPHTADYMVTRLVRMAGAMKGGPELVPETHDGLAEVDEARMVAQSTALGQAASAAYDAWQAALPPDVGPEHVLQEPTGPIPHFSAATLRWVGGNTQVDNPRVKVQKDGAGVWRDFADMSGEIQTRVYWPADLAGAASAYTGQYRWEWLANFETFLPPNNRLDGTPAGKYRFVVDGCINDNFDSPGPEAAVGRLTSLLLAAAPDAAHGILGELLGDGCPGGSRPYRLESSAFDVVARPGPIPTSYVSEFPYVRSGDNGRFCPNCTFRPWAEGMN